MQFNFDKENQNHQNIPLHRLESQKNPLEKRLDFAVSLRKKNREAVLKIKRARASMKKCNYKPPKQLTHDDFEYYIECLFANLNGVQQVRENQLSRIDGYRKSEEMPSVKECLSYAKDSLQHLTSLMERNHKK